MARQRLASAAKPTEGNVDELLPHHWAGLETEREALWFVPPPFRPKPDRPAEIGVQWYV